MAGFHSPLFFLGIASPPVVADCGVRSMLAPWIGGACSPSEGTQGYRSMFAFWAGGACSIGSTPPTPPSSGGGGGFYFRRDYHEPRKPDAWIADDEEIVELMAMITPYL